MCISALVKRYLGHIDDLRCKDEMRFKYIPVMLKRYRSSQTTHRYIRASVNHL